MAKVTTERVSALQRPPAGPIDLHGFDTRATPGFAGPLKATIESVVPIPGPK